MRKIWLILFFCPLLLHSCALLTSHKKFTIDRKAELSFSDKVCFSDDYNYTFFFYEDGSCLLIKTININELNAYLNNIDYNVYGKWSGDQWFRWGVYKVQKDTIVMEFLEKIDQWGFMGMCRWRAILENKEEMLKILPGPENRKIKDLNYFSLPHKEIVLQKTVSPDYIKIDPVEAWVNK